MPPFPKIDEVLTELLLCSLLAVFIGFYQKLHNIWLYPHSKEFAVKMCPVGLDLFCTMHCSCWMCSIEIKTINRLCLYGTIMHRYGTLNFFTKPFTHRHTHSQSIGWPLPSKGFQLPETSVIGQPTEPLEYFKMQLKRLHLIVWV